MSLRTKIVLFVLLVSSVFTGTSWLVQRLIVLPEFVQLERREAVADLSRGTQALMRDAEFVATMAQDYAAWDDSYHYIVDGNPTFEKTNLIPPTLINLRLNLLLFVMSDGGVRWGQILDAKGEPMPGAAEVIAGLARADHPLIAHAGPTSKKAGVIQTPLGPLLVGSAAITSSDQESPVRGAVVMGRFVDAAMVAELTERTRVALAIHSVSAVPDAERFVLTQLEMPDSSWSDASSPDTMRSYRVVRDIFGAPALLVRTDSPRVVSARGQHAANLAVLMGLVSGLALLVVMWAALSLMIARPLERMTKHAVRVGASNDLSDKLCPTSQDEIGVLGREFDRMMDRLAQSRSELVQAAHVAGSAEVAASVLHNVGNVLNSVGVSVGLVTETIAHSEVASLGMISDLLRKHEHDLQGFLAHDERGRHLPAFLMELGPQLLAENEHAREELKTLAGSVEHIRQIVQAHQAYGQAHPWLEEVDAAVVVDQALLLVVDSFQRHGIRVERNFAALDRVRIDPNRTVQILTNLLANATRAIVETGRDSGCIGIELASTVVAGEQRLCVRVRDDGVGIPPENLERIFAPGFTTRPDGHGIGLHSAANLTAEMGGTLTGASEGPGTGAVFTLQLPVRPAARGARGDGDSA